MEKERRLSKITLNLGLIRLDLNPNCLDQVARYLGLVLLIYPLAFYFFPKLNIEYLLGRKISIGPLPNWGISIILGVLLLFIRRRYLRIIFYLFNGRFPVDELYQLTDSPFCLNNVGLGKFQKRVFLPRYHPVIDTIKELEVKTNEELLAKINVKNDYQELRNDMDIHKLLFDRLIFNYYIRSDIYKTLSERAHRFILGLAFVIAYLLIILTIYGWQRTELIKRGLPALQNVYMDVIVKSSFAFPPNISSVKNALNTANVALSLQGANSAFESERSIDQLHWLFSELSVKGLDSEVVWNRILDSFANYSKSPSDTYRKWIYILKGRISYILSKSGLYNNWLDKADSCFNLALLLDKKESSDLDLLYNAKLLSLNGLYVCTMSRIICKTARDSSDYINLIEFYEKMRENEKDIDRFADRNQQAILAKYWNNKGYVLLELFAGYWWFGKDSSTISTIIKSKNYNWSDLLSKRPERFLDSLVQHWFDSAYVLNNENGNIIESFAALERVRAKYFYRTKLKDNEEIFNKYIKNEMTSRLEVAAQFGWPDKTELKDDNYRRAYHFDIIDSLGHKDWIDSLINRLNRVTHSSAAGM
jgi:hypothetical protein